MCENWAAWMKADRRQCGSANGHDYLMQVARNSDLNVLARFFYDQVDLKELSHNQKLKHISIFNEEHNCQVEKQLLQDGPVLFDKFACVFKSIQVNDTIPQFMQNVSGDSIENDDKYDSLKRGLKKYSENVSDDSDDSDDDNEQKRNANVASRWRSRVSNIHQVVKNVQNAQMNKVKKKVKKKPKKRQKFQRKSW